MIALLLIIIAVCAIALGAHLLIRLKGVAGWMDDAEIEIEERHPRKVNPLDLENTEYNWGHNIKNYMEE